MLDVVVHDYNPSTRKAEAVQISEFLDSMLYRVSSRRVRTTKKISVWVWGGRGKKRNQPTNQPTKKQVRMVHVCKPTTQRHRHFWERISLSGLGARCIDQAGLELRHLPASASQLLGLKACTQPGPQILCFYVCLLYFVFKLSKLF